ncbi:MAG TPA: bifunctional methylenetetrahydrofolate dehydrogenase/methenyltetrahydrofolate cyclohydrolase FolD [Candidatus Krumholzibacteria bacterium]
MKLIDGKVVAAQIRSEVARDVTGIPGRKPTLALVRVGEDPASRVYVGTKAKACEECGIGSRNAHLPEDVSEEKLLRALREFNDDPDVDGILLQLPLPRHIDSDRAIATISPAKDVDGFHPESLGRLAAGAPRFVPCTPLGIRELLIRHGVKTAGANVVVLGRSVIVGKPMSLLFSLKGPGGDATVTVCHSRSRDLADHTRRADIIVAAMGVAHFLKADMVREGVVVVDVGINRIDDPKSPKGYRIVGDVDFDAVAPKCSMITPVPGGVGPMTVAMLMSNTLTAFKNRQEGHVLR